MFSTLRRTKARALTLTRSISSALKLTIGTPSHQHGESSSSRQPDNAQALMIGRPKRLRRTPLPVFAKMHLISQLPYELLAHVFVLGAESDPMLPITVSHVCRTWRHLALRTPALWRHIFLDHRLDMWEERIQRAKACPLDVKLVPWFMHYARRQQNYRQDMTTAQLCMHVMAPHIQRWRSLEIVFNDYSPYLWNAALSGCCFTGRNVQAPLLEDLTLLYRNNDDTKEFYLFSNYAPRLQRVTLDGIKLTWTPSLFGNLTFLDYTHHGFTRGYSAVREVLGMLRVCPDLVELRLLFPHKRPVHYNSIPVPLEVIPVVLTRLIDLRLCVEGRAIPFELPQVAALLRTPTLKHLHLVDMDERNHPLPNVGLFFCNYNFPISLRVLFIEYGWYDLHALSPILRTPSPIRRVMLRRPKMPPQVMELTRRR
ncbi:hypothetical protein AX15_000051 [Amanita polypyramis BW_CC]|nr:hypothetical protein AX15_000051 [Amanita polypyramis BW_CC]